MTNAGYTPAFGTIYNGTLFGRWPTAAVWASLLPLIDAKGHIEMTHEAIAGMTGWPMELLREGIVQLCQPDPGSRSRAEDGRRLVSLDTRGWGWRVVNVQMYRDRASGRDQIEDGRNAAKVKRYRERHREAPPDTARHRATPPDTHSDSYANTDSNKKKTSLRSVSARARRCPTDFEISEAMREWARREAPDTDIDAETLKFRDHEYAEPKSDWPAAWRTWMRRALDFKPRQRVTDEPQLTWRPGPEDC